MKRTIAPKDAVPSPVDPKKIVRLLPEQGNLYKANLHTHSTVTDGSFSPEELKKLYMAEGYSAVAFTDHRYCVPHTELTDENFVALTGFEVDFSQKDSNGYTRKTVHINGISRDPKQEKTVLPQDLDYDIINRTIEELKAANYFVTFNHPVFSVNSTEDLMAIKGFDGMEVYNSIGTMFNNYSDDSAFYEYFLRNGGKAIPIGGDDCHMHFEDNTPFAEYFQGFTVLKAPELTYDALIHALDHGHSFASTGPMFHNLWLEGDILHVECSPVCGVFVHGKYLSYKTVDVVRDDSITHTELDISGLRACSPYIWVQLRDTAGKKAWATPYWFK